MPPPQATYLARSSNTGYDPATLSDDEDDTDAASVASSSVWSSAAHARASAGTSIPTLAVLDGRIPATAATDGSPPSAQADEVRDWKVSRVGGEPVRLVRSLRPRSCRLGLYRHSPCCSRSRCRSLACSRSWNAWADHPFLFFIIPMSRSLPASLACARSVSS